MVKDQEIFDLIEREHQRQLKGMELIASENFVSDEVMNAMGFLPYQQVCRGSAWQALLWWMPGGGYRREPCHRTREESLWC